MDKLEYRSVIRFLVLEGISPSEIHSRMIKVYGDLSPSASTIKKWAAEFKRGRTSIKDDPREGRPIWATREYVVEKVLDQITGDRRLKVREIADAIEVSTGSTFEILTKKLKMRKFFGRWVPSQLTDEDKLKRKKAAKLCLEILDDKNQDSFKRCVTMGETWIHIYEPQLNRTTIEPSPKLKKASATCEKMLAFVFWDAEGILFINYVEKDEKVDGEYICNVIEQFNQRLQQRRPNILNEIVYLYPDAAQAHDERVLTKISEFNYKLLEQPPHSPDLSPSDYHLFPKLENFLQAKRFTTVDEAIEAVEQYFHNLPVSNYSDGIESLKKRWSECIAFNGNYLELKSTNEVNSKPGQEDTTEEI